MQNLAKKLSQAVRDPVADGVGSRHHVHAGPRVQHVGVRTVLSATPPELREIVPLPYLSHPPTSYWHK